MNAALQLLERATAAAVGSFDHARALATNYQFQGGADRDTARVSTLPENLYASIC